MSARLATTFTAGLLASFALASAQAQQPAPKGAPAAKAPAAPAVGAQGRDALKGKLKPGLYEVTMEVDLSGVPGVPKDKAKQSQTRQQCITQEEVNKGIENDPNCPMTSYAAAGNQISIAATCKDGAATETKMTFNPNGYSAEMKVTGKHEGKTVTSQHRMSSKYLGPCK